MPSELARWGDHYREPQTFPHAALEKAPNAAMPVGVRSRVRDGPWVFILVEGTIEHVGDVAGTGTYFAVSPDRMSTLAVSCNWRIWNPDEITAELVQIWFQDDEVRPSRD